MYIFNKYREIEEWSAVYWKVLFINKLTPLQAKKINRIIASNGDRLAFMKYSEVILGEKFSRRLNDGCKNKTVN